MRPAGGRPQTTPKRVRHLREPAPCRPNALHDVDGGLRTGARERVECDDVPVPGRPAPKQADLGFLDALSDAVAVANADGSTLFVNRAAEQLLGVTSGLLLGRPLSLALFSSADQD